MRKTVRLMSAVGPAERLGRVIATLPPEVQGTLADVASRRDLPLAAGSWQEDGGGCLVANAVAVLHAPSRSDHGDRTLDLRMLDAFPRMSSRDLNALVVVWDEAAAQDGSTDDASLRRLLLAGLRWAGVATAAPGVPGVPGSAADGDARPADADAAPHERRRVPAEVG